jgi:hypothetical protein
LEAGKGKIQPGARAELVRLQEIALSAHGQGIGAGIRGGRRSGGAQPVGHVGFPKAGQDGAPLEVVQEGQSAQGVQDAQVGGQPPVRAHHQSDATPA